MVRLLSADARAGPARHIGVDRASYGPGERGECNITFDDYIVKIAEGLDTTPSALCALSRL